MANKTINQLTASSATLSLNDQTILYGTPSGSGQSTRKATFGKIVDDLKLVKNYSNAASTNLVLQNTNSQNPNSSFSLGTTGEVNINGTSININGSSSVNIDNIPIPSSNLKAANKLYVDNNISPLTQFRSVTFDGYGTKGRGYMTFNPTGWQNASWAPALSPSAVSRDYASQMWIDNYEANDQRIYCILENATVGSFNYSTFYLDLKFIAWDSQNALTVQEVQNFIAQNYTNTSNVIINKIINQTSSISIGENYNTFQFHSLGFIPGYFSNAIEVKISFVLNMTDSQINDLKLSLNQSYDNSTWEVQLQAPNRDDYISIGNGTIILTEDTQAAGLTTITNQKWYKIQSECLPIATTSTPGAIKIGDSLSIDSKGYLNFYNFINITYSYTHNVANQWECINTNDPFSLPANTIFIGRIYAGYGSGRPSGIGWGTTITNINSQMVQDQDGTDQITKPTQYVRMMYMPIILFRLDNAAGDYYFWEKRAANSVTNNIYVQGMLINLKQN